LTARHTIFITVAILAQGKEDAANESNRHILLLGKSLTLGLYVTRMELFRVRPGSFFFAQWHFGRFRRMDVRICNDVSVVCITRHLYRLFIIVRRIFREAAYE